MMTAATSKPRLLILFFSFSGQTIGLLHRMAAGIEEGGCEVVLERLRPVEQLRFPVGTVFATLKMMVRTLFRPPMEIKELTSVCDGDFDLVVLAGPTWSYNPSGPVLTLLKRDGRRLFKGRGVLPFISCRGYWRVHWYGLRRKLIKCGAVVPNCIVFSHPCPEPWRTFGVFMKIAGLHPERSVICKYYQRYGHSKEQQEEAYRFGLQLGSLLVKGEDPASINFQTSTALP